MIKWFTALDTASQTIIISSGTSIVIFVLGSIFGFIKDRYSLSYKLKKEFNFEQKKKLKEEIAKNKTHLLNSVEELNHRLWNFSQNVDKMWHCVPEDEWFKKDDQYYINSFVYRFLCFIHWTIKTERDTITVDTTIADANDILFLKYVKTFKNIFTDTDLLKNLDYNNEHNTNHFYKNDLIGYSKLVTKDENVMDFDLFVKALEESYSPLKKVIEYFSKIKNLDSDKNLNILRCFHLITIAFLNKFGHDYQRTDNEKIKKSLIYIILKY